MTCPSPDRSRKYSADVTAWQAVYAVILSQIKVLKNAQVIDVKEIPESGRVIFGSTVKIINIEDQHETIYKIVGNLESNPDIGNISIETPIAKGLIGKFVDDEVKIITPSGEKIFEVVEVKHI